MFLYVIIMRLDKYLKVSRIIKRRTVANEACDESLVVVNGKRAKASYDVKVGDIIEISTHSDSEFKNTKKLSRAQRQQLIESLTKEMKAAARLLEFEHAAYLRDRINKLRNS